MTIAAAAPRTAGGKALPVAVGALTVTQIVGWGTTFHVPAVLSARIAAGTGLPGEIVFGGITLMLVVAAAASPATGRVLERDGCRRWMMLGSCLTALGLSILSVATGPVMFALAWSVFGAAMPLALNQAASTALVQIAPGRARKAIAILLLLTGLSSTLAWPALIWLDGVLGWRQALLVCAGVHLFVCLPLHAFGLPRGRVAGEVEEVRPAAKPLPEIRPVPDAFPLAAAGFSLAGMLTWGLPLHMVAILQDFGHPEATAVFIGALLGPGQVLARGFEMAGGHRFGILAVGVGSAALMPLALGVLLLAGSTIAGAVAFSVGYGLSAGLISIVRAVAPLRLFGVAAYARVTGRLGVPQNIAFAMAPLGFAAIRETFGTPALVGVALALGLLCLLAMLALARKARRAQAAPA